MKKQRSDTYLLENELISFDIDKQLDGTYIVVVGDESFPAPNLDECKKHIELGISELKQIIWEDWQDLSHIATLVSHNNSGNSSGLNNLIFLNAVKKSYFLSKIFTDLSDVSDCLKNLFFVDASEVHNNLIEKFNHKYLRIKLLHYLIMRELYRIHLIRRSQKILKSAQVSGPWSNLDLPMKERVWEWSEDEEYFDNRQRARREQVRYNPENNKMGFYYVWQDLTRDPYSFEDIQKDSPYKSRSILTIP